MMTKSMVKSTGAEDMGQFLDHLDPDTRKIRNLEKIKLEMINSVLLLYIYIYIYIYTHTHKHTPNQRCKCFK